MTDTLSRIFLGSVPANKHGVDLCIRFKREINKRLGRVDGAFLLTVEDEGRRGIEVVSAPDEPEAKRWAEAARDEAAAVWEQVKRGRERVRT